MREGRPAPAHARHWSDLQLLEGHVGLIGLDFVCGQGQSEFEDLCFLSGRVSAGSPRRRIRTGDVTVT